MSSNATSSTPLCLHGAKLFDPAIGLMGQAGDLWVQGERFVAFSDLSVKDRAAARRIDLSDRIVMPGGIDLHTHIGGGKLTLARMLLNEQRPADYIPSTERTGRAYASLGYTAAFEPAMIACNARQTHAEMADTPLLDTGAYVMLGNDAVLLNLIASNASQSLINDYVAWMITATQSIGVKVVNAGGIDAFKFNVRQLDVDAEHPKYGVTPGSVIRTLARAVYEIGLPHPLHIHCSNLGIAGNIQSTLATIEAAAGYPIHLTHVQFHSYGSEGPLKFSSAAAELAAALAKHPNVTIDVGQIMFGQTVTISGDTMRQYANSAFARPRKSALIDIECQSGCGAVPFRYRHRSFVHSLQWAIGLELFLMVDDPARVQLTTDHPNGASFTSYPHLIRLLMDRNFRETALAEIDAEAQSATQLRGLEREYSLAEICTMTRTAPAKLLGLTDVGTLAPGAIADAVVYADHPNRETMFANPMALLRQGQLLSVQPSIGRLHEQSTTLDSAIETRTLPIKRTHTVRPAFDPASLPQLAALHAEHSSFRMERMWISDDELAAQVGSIPVIQPCRPRQDLAADLGARR